MSKQEYDQVFHDMQDSMEQKALIYKGGQLDPFYRFVIGEIDFEECVEGIALNFEKELRNEG